MTDKQKAEAGRRGGLKGGSTRTEKTKLRGFGSLSLEQRKEISRRALEIRYGKKKVGE